MKSPSPLTFCAALLLGGTLANCTSLSPQSRHEEMELAVPDAWANSAASQAGIDHLWLDRFDDNQLTDLVEEALSANPDLLAAAANLDAAARDAKIAGAAGRPTLEAAFTPSRARSNFVGFPFGDPSDTVPTITTNSFGLGLNAAWELDLWGRVRAAASTAQANFEASNADYRAARTSLAAQVARAYFALLESRSQVTLAEESLTLYRETEDAVRGRFESGDDRGGTGAQLRLASSDVAAARASLATQKNLQLRASRQLETLVGRYPAGGLRANKSLPSPPPRPPSGLPSELLLRRPDVVAAERRFAASGQAMKEASRARFPRLSITGSAGTSTDDFDTIFDSDFGIWRLAGNLAQPILAGGQLKANLEQSKSRDRAAMHQLQSAVLKAFGEVEDALASESLLAEQESALREAAELAAEAGEEARADYANGVGDLLTALSAQTRELAARSQLINVRRQRLDNRINLHLALGGDFEVHPDHSPSQES